MRAERQVLFWSGVALLLIIMIGLLKDILLPFVAGMVIAYFLNPLAGALQRIGFSRLWATLLILLAAIIAMVALIVFVVPLLASQAQELAVGLPGELERLSKIIVAWAHEKLGPRYTDFQAALVQAIESVTKNWTGIAAWIASSLWDQSRAVVNFFSLVLVTPLVVFYMLLDWEPMLEKVNGWLPRTHAEAIRKLASDINASVSAFIRGQGTVCIILGVFYAVGLTLVGLNYGLLVGIATGIFTFIPFVGWALGITTATILALIQFWPDAGPIAMVVGVFLVGMTLDSGFLSPKIVGSEVGLHPVWLIFALIVFSYLFGFVGVLVAVPVSAAIGVLTRFALKVYLQSPYYEGEPDKPVSNDGKTPNV